MTQPNKQYWEGYDAFIDGELPDHCPYLPGSVEAEDWLIGWKDAGYDI